MSETPSKISVKEIYKIFGPDPASVLERVRAGASKSEILDETGHTVGLRDVSLEIRPGETFVIMGLSGSGKSTLIRHFNLLIEPTAGHILVDGHDVVDMGTEELRDLRRHRMSMVFQRFALLPHKTVLENAVYGLKVAGVDKSEAEQRAREQIELVGLGGFEKQYPSQLSGGMQQRVGLARALATQSEILLMDEAFSALDPLIRNDMQGQLLELQQTLHKTIVFITHDLDEALRLGDHIAILKDGALSQVGTAEEILMDPADDYVARFVRDVNRSRVITVGSIVSESRALRLSEVNPQSVAAGMEETGQRAIYVVDEDNRPIGAADEQVFARVDGSSPVRPEHLHEPATVTTDMVIEEMLPTMATRDYPLAVVDHDGRFLGTVSRRDTVSELVPRATEPEAAMAEAGAPGGR